MNRKTVTRFAFAAIVAPALAFGAPAVAMADTFYDAGGSAAGPEGAVEWNVTSVAEDGVGGNFAGGGNEGHRDGLSAENGEEGGTFYAEEFSAAGQDGAAQGYVVSGAN